MPLIKKASELRLKDERLSERDFGGLVESLHGLNEEARRWAARDLADFPDAVAPLFAQLQVEPSRAVRDAIFTSLLRIGNSEAHGSLTQLLRSEDAEMRNSAIEVLRSQPPEVAPLIERLLSDMDPDVRIFAVSIIGSLSSEEVPQWLTRVVANELNINVCCAAIELLAEVGSSDCLLTLESAKHRFAQQDYLVFAVNTAVDSIRSREVR